jgi:hypothetical protein
LEVQKEAAENKIVVLEFCREAKLLREEQGAVDVDRPAENT